MCQKLCCILVANDDPGPLVLTLFRSRLTRIALLYRLTVRLFTIYMC